MSNPDSDAQSPDSKVAQSGDVSYVLVHAKQWKSGVRDIGPALRQQGLKSKIASLIDVYQHSRIGRGLARYSMQKGRIAAGAISYMAIFSLSAVVTVAWVIFTHFFSASAAFQSLVIDTVNRFVPGLIANPATGTSGIVDLSDISLGNGTLVAGIIAFVAAFWTAMQIIRYIVDGLRSMFGLLDYPGTAMTAYPRYFAGLILLFLGVITTAVLTVMTGRFEEWVVSVFPGVREILETHTFGAIRLGVPSLVDFLMFMVMVTFVARIAVPRRTLLVGAVMFAVASTTLRFGGEALMGASNDPVIATIATAAALLLWVNFVARAALMVSAWMADPPAVVMKVKKDSVHADKRPNYVTLSRPATLAWPHNPVTGDLIPAHPLDADVHADPDELEASEDDQASN